MGKKAISERRRHKASQQRVVFPWLWLGVGLGALGLLTLISLLPLDSGFLRDFLAPLILSVLGWSAPVLGFLLIFLSVFLFWRKEKVGDAEKKAGLGLGLIFLSLTGLFHFLAAKPDPQSGSGGGIIGWSFHWLLSPIIGEVGAVLVLTTTFLGGVIVFLWPYRQEIISSGKRLFTEYKTRTIALSSKASSPGPAILPPPEARPIKPLARKIEGSSKATQVASRTAVSRGIARDADLPPLDLLQKSPERAWEEEDIEKKAGIIEQTLASFGVPAKVVSIVPGPTVTQFGLEPGYVPTREGGPPRRVRVNQITALAKDLELALATSPVRIEAPVPGRPVVGVEVPNSEIAVVSLRGVLESSAFQRSSSPLKLALGRNVSGDPVVTDLATMPHLLIAGATGSGKSVCLGTLVTCLLFHNPPQRLQLILIDPKPVELVHFSGLPHILDKVFHDVEESLEVLGQAIAEMQRRYQYFKEIGARHLDQYNARAPAQDRETLPYIVIVIDELADLILYAPFEVEQRITRLAQMSRATGIHLVIATQRPSVDVVTGLIKANFPARISFAVSSQIDSRVVLDVAGAENLLGRGDMLFKAPDSASPVRLQGSFVSDAEIQALVRWWQEKYPQWEGEQLPEAELLGKPEDHEEGDELLEQAVALIREHRYVSTSFLQRKLGIGYPRAARLMDQLEEMGYVSSPESGGRSRKVLPREEGRNIEG